MFWINVNLPDSEEPKQSAKDAFYMSAFTHPKDIFPWRGLNTGAKVQ
jgi:hypothetical protein